MQEVNMYKNFLIKGIFLFVNWGYIKPFLAHWGKYLFYALASS